MYPFIFDSIGDWGVEVSVNPPEGFVADQKSLSEEVTNEVEALQFTITDVGSRYVPTKVMYKIRHKGRSEIVRSQIGISLTPEFAKAKGLDIAELKAQGVHFSRCDCDHIDPAVNPRAPELCDGIDDDCEGKVEERFVDTDEVGIADRVVTVLLSPIQIKQVPIAIAFVVAVIIARVHWKRLRLMSIRRLN